MGVNYLTSTLYVIQDSFFLEICSAINGLHTYF